MIQDHRQDRHAPCPMAFRDGAFVQRATPPADGCPPACRELYRRLCERLAVPSSTPPRGNPDRREDGCEGGTTLLTIQAQWLERAADHERERGRAGSWLHDRHRLAALRQLRAMALCLAQGRPRGRKAGTAPPNANDRREMSRRS